MHIVYLEWADAASRVGWKDLTDTDFKTVKVRSMGILVSEDDSRISFTTSVSIDNDGCDVLSIPKGWVTTRKDFTFKADNADGNPNPGASFSEFS